MKDYKVDAIINKEILQFKIFKDKPSLFNGDVYTLEISNSEGHIKSIGVKYPAIFLYSEVINLSGHKSRLTDFELFVLMIRAFQKKSFYDLKNEIIIDERNYEELIIRNSDVDEVKNGILYVLYLYFRERPNHPFMKAVDLYCSLPYDIRAIRNCIDILKQLEEIEFTNGQTEHWFLSAKINPQKYRDIERSIRDGEIHPLEIQANSIDGSNALLKLVKLFVSYSNMDKIIVGYLKKELESYCVEVFLAHHDIEPSREWEDEILENLYSCNVFLPLLTDNFHRSFWTDQESGIAFSNKKIIIPLKLSIDPYGFLGRYQALVIKKENIETTCEEIIKTIGSKSELHIEFRNSLIEKFSKSCSFEEAHRNTVLICSYQDYNTEQIERILKYAIENYQIHQSFRSMESLKLFISEYNGKINDALFGKFNEKFS